MRNPNAEGDKTPFEQKDIDFYMFQTLKRIFVPYLQRREIMPKCYCAKQKNPKYQICEKLQKTLEGGIIFLS